MDLHIIELVAKNSILITGLVLTMMLMIEFLNVNSHGHFFSKLQSSKFKQVVLAAILGVIPGCVGGFAAVSLFTHRLISFGALVAMMIASSGDEAFIMLAMIPKTAILVFVSVFVISIVVGFTVDKLFKKPVKKFVCNDGYEVHNTHIESTNSIFKLSSYKNLKQPSKQRFFLMIGIALFTIANLTGFLAHSHSHGETHHDHTMFFSDSFANYLFALLSIVTLLFTAVSSEHFIKEHIISHVIKKHLFTVFAWTFGALLIIQIALHHWDLELLIRDNIPFMILFAVLIGILPESGPHLIFITLFASGLVPFSVLISSSIVQDGHATLPLFAESKKTFIKAKIINVIVGLIVGYGLYLLGF